MKARSFISAGTLAIALAGMVGADMASAADRPERSGRGWSERSQDGGQRPDGGDRGNWQYRATRSESAPDQLRTDSRPSRNWAPEAQAAPAPQAPARQADRPARADGQRGTWWNGQNRQQDSARDAQREAQRETWRNNNQGQTQSWRGDRDAQRDGNVQREGWRGNDRRDDDRRGDSWRNNGSRGDSWRGNNSRNDSWRGDRRDWDRGSWRRDNRYDWQRYRDSHRSTFRIGRYYAPYHSYSYRRLGIGFTLGSLFYGRNYWIADPWAYRLPEVYGPYRWVRYYDDVLLVDIYTGEVVDVIYDFFW